MPFLNKNATRLNIYISSLCLVLYILNQYYLKVLLPKNIFINGYFNDLLAMPLVFSLIYLAGVKFRVKWVPFNSTSYYVYTLLFSCFMFEYVRSFYIVNSTNVPYDIICYLLGTLLYLLSLFLMRSMR